MSDPVWLATSLFPNDPRWHDDGSRSDETFIEGVAATVELAKAYVLSCCQEQPRWFQTKAGWATVTLAERGNPLSETHFHCVSAWSVAESVDDQGWPVT